MDFSWNEEQLRLRQDVVGFAQRELAADVVALDRREAFDRDGWAKCGRFGLHGLTLPEEYGGRGLDALTAVCALEGLGYGCEDNGLIFALHAHIWACATPLLTFGDAAQKERFLPGLGDGTCIGGHAMSEADAGSDAYSLATTAERRGDTYYLNGHKSFVGNGTVADLTLTFANVDPAGSKRGITAFLVEKGASGLGVEGPVSKMGVRTAMTGQMTMEDCAVPVADRLGAEGAGLSIFAHAMEWERGFILASAVGSMERLLERCLRHARTRRQFGQAIGKFQLVAGKVVEMKMRLEAARAHLYRFAWLKAQGKTAIAEAAMAKLYISEAWVQTCLEAIQIHGGGGYLTETGLERQLRDAIGSRIYSGTSEIQQGIIAQFLGLPAADRPAEKTETHELASAV